MKIEFWIWVAVYTIETLIIKLMLGVDSWLLSILLSVTVGSFVIWLIKQAPDLLD